MQAICPRPLYEFLASVDAGKKERGQDYLLAAAAPLLVCVLY